jgi:hypothetical protein
MTSGTVVYDSPTGPKIKPETFWTCWGCYTNSRTKSYTKNDFFNKSWELEDEIEFAEEVNAMLIRVLPSDHDWIECLFEAKDG